MRNIVIGVILAATGASAVFYLKPDLLRFVTDSELVRVCEEQIKERLRSPSTYVRIEATEYPKLVLQDEIELFDDDITMTEQRAIEEGRYDPTNFEIFIKYEAANAYGTPVAGLSMCEYFSISGKAENIFSFNVKVDGETNHDQMLRAIIDGQ